MSSFVTGISPTSSPVQQRKDAANHVTQHGESACDIQHRESACDVEHGKVSACACGAAGHRVGSKDVPAVTNPQIPFHQHPALLTQQRFRAP